MEFLSLPLLIFSPIIVAILLFTPIFSDYPIRTRRFAKAFQSLHFIYTLAFLIFFQNTGDAEFYKEITIGGASWLQMLNVKISFGIDGVALLMILLTSFITLLAMIASKNVIRKKHSFYYAMILLLECAVLGVFCARDMFLFFLFWELELLPMYFLIGQWGDEKAKKSAMKFVLYTFFGSLFTLAGILILYSNYFSVTGTMTADFSNLIVDRGILPVPFQMLISIFLLIGFAVKVPIFPLHTWLPDAHVDAPTPVSMLLAAILLKMGIYGIIRFNIGLLPDTFVLMAPVLAFLALVNIIYAGIIAYHQTDLKKIVAYSSISNMGIVLLGLFSVTVVGFDGAVFHMISHGIISAALFMIVGVIYLRCKTREISQLGGLGQVMPNLMALSIIIGLGAVGMPLLMGFVGEFLSIFGAFLSPLDFQITAVFAMIVLILSACYVLKILHKTFFGNMFERWQSVKDLMNHEFIVLFTAAVAIIVFGLFPMGIINLAQPVVMNLLGNVRF